MTFEDLKEQGVLLPEEEWGKHDLSSTAPRLPLLAALLLAAASIVAALAGDGGPLTFIAVGVFLLTLFALTWILDRAVARQRGRTRRERAESRGGGKGAESTEG